MYSKNNMDVTALEVSTDFNQCASIRMKFRCEEVNLHIVYRSPNSKKNNDDALCKWVKELSGTNILIGDFNLPDIDWQNGIAGSRGREFLDTTMEGFYEQLVQFPTHTSGNVLDLILCNREGMIDNVKAEGRVGKSDHDLLSFMVCVEKRKEVSNQRIFNYQKADFEEMRKVMADVSWSREWEGCDVNSLWLSLKAKIKDLMAVQVPMKSKKGNDATLVDGP